MNIPSRELVMKAVRGEPVERIPFSFWYHFRTEPWFPVELQPEYGGTAAPDVLQAYVNGMLREELAFYHRYQPDILKVMHDVPYEMPPGMPVVQSPDDWARLPVLSPHEGHFGAQLALLKRLRENLPAGVPIIETVFNPFYYANKMAQGRLLEHLQYAPDKAHTGLQTLLQTLTDYAQAVIQVCDGIYYAINGISEDTAPREVYEKHILPLDKQILQSVAYAPLNVLHVHGYGELYADLLADAPVAVVCWSDRSCTLSLREGKKLFQKCVMGGLNEVHLPNYSPEQIRAEAEEAIQSTGLKSFILAPGCAVATDIKPELLDTIRVVSMSE